jgi:hypothetical protein
MDIYWFGQQGNRISSGEDHRSNRHS